MMASKIYLDSDRVEEARGKSQSAYAYEILRIRILRGVHAPGEKLRIQELATEFDVSPGAMREALSRLVPEQLVVAREQRGFHVAPLSIEDLEDLTDLRCSIEAIALRRSVERGDVNWEAGILAAAHRLRGTAYPQNYDPVAEEEWRLRHTAFHAALVAACGSRRLTALHAQLYEQSERYRSLSAPAEPNRDVEKEHHALVDLALARDADGLVAAMEHHLRFTTQLVVQSFNQRSEQLQK
ncbi:MULTISPECIES: FCD domain-containing protein [Sphingobium]|uniref:HTH gntR-type domain-containing protein n=1 Tax=Sphingobium chungbukense TaxID=56193 RepID=A0A0M3ART8_9SPHN|nr:MULTISPECIES: FCD domain-containing protein [Sphingobium]KKW91636.1 hypothetical protein YP76_14790 [Sphingobium chungbukense]